MPALWIIRRTSGTRFPFHVNVEQDGRTLLAVRAASPWPGPGQQVFCLRDDGSDDAELLEIVEQVPILQVTRLGRKLAVVLDRPLRKRCEFLFIDKPYKDRPGSYEQVFFRTESGIRSHRSRSCLEVRPEADAPLTVVIDTAERYPWRFPAATVLRRKLAAGDYAVLASDQVVATVERKSFDNLPSVPCRPCTTAWHTSRVSRTRLWWSRRRTPTSSTTSDSPADGRHRSRHVPSPSCR